MTPCGGALTSCACLAACAAALGTGLDTFSGEFCLAAPPPRDKHGQPASPDRLDAYLQGKQRAAERSGFFDGVPWPVAPAAACGAAGCGGRGACGGPGRGCACLPGWRGGGCAVAAPPPCLNDCSGRGQCTASAWCACAPGFWGDDCALSRDAAGATRLWSHPPRSSSATSVVRRPLIYIYHLPGAVGAWYAPRSADRTVGEMLLERLASSEHRTANGSEADLFLIPLPLRKARSKCTLQTHGS